MKKIEHSIQLKWVLFDDITQNTNPSNMRMNSDRFYPRLIREANVCG